MPRLLMGPAIVGALHSAATIMMALCAFAVPEIVGFEGVKLQLKDCCETTVDHLHAPISLEQQEHSRVAWTAFSWD